MNLNKNIFDLRKKKGLSQDALAEQIDVSRQTISNWEKGETSPNPEQLILLSKVLDISIDNLVGNEFVSASNKSVSKSVYIGAVIICAVCMAVFAITANRFSWYEILFIALAGAAVGFGIGLIINSILIKTGSDKNK